jgi:acetyl-CoA acetyltransferase family protein
LNTAVIVDAIRTPMGRGKPGGALALIHPVDLLAGLLRAIVDRNRLDPGTVDDVIVGCVSQCAEQSATPGRMALLAAGFPHNVPSTTIDRKCGSSQQAVHFAAQGIASGAYDIVIAAGVESMSRVPMGSARQGADPFGTLLGARYPDGFVSQGVAAELVADKWRISREALDSYSAASHRRAATARDAGWFAAEVVPCQTTGGLILTDETIRDDTTTAGLTKLKTAFNSPEMVMRFPDLEWRVTAGNSSQITDGAAALLIVNEKIAEQRGLRARARFVAFDVCGDDPVLMLTAPIPATRRVLSKSRLRPDDIAHYEVNEAFASVPLAWLEEFRVSPESLNPRGGAIALGHPLGASGVRLMTTMLNGLEQTGGKYGLQTMCEAGGMANATIIERL